MSEKSKRVSDLIGCPFYPVEEHKVEEIEGVDLEIIAYQVRDGKYGPEAHIEAKGPDGDLCVRTTSKVVIYQLADLAQHLPVVGAFHREKNYHILR